MPDIESSPLTPEQERIVSEAEDASKKTDASLAEFGKQLITLNSAMIAAYVAALKLIGPLPRWHDALPITVFLFSLVLTLISIYPRLVTLQTSDVQEIALARDKGLRRWHCLLTMAMWAYVLGIIAGLVWILIVHRIA